MAEITEMEPFTIREVEAGSYQLWLYDADMEQVEDVFHDHGAEGNGHGWEGLAYALTHQRFPDLSDAIWFGSEGGTFVAGGTDMSALQRLMGLLHAAFHDRVLLAQLIREARIG